MSREFPDSLQAVKPEDDVLVASPTDTPPVVDTGADAVAELDAGTIVGVAAAQDDSASEPVELTDAIELTPDAIVEGASEPWSPPAPTDASVTPPVAAGDGNQPPVPPVPSNTPAADENPDDDDEFEDGPPMTLTEHLGELRIRLVRILIGAGLGFLVCYGVSEQLFMWLAQPLAAVMPEDTKLIYTSVPEGFFVYLKVAFVAGVFVASPYIFYQVWAFIAPGLYREERQQVMPLALCSALFFLLGASFCYFLVFPYAFTFFMSYSTGMIVAMPSINEYLSFSLKMILAFGLIFEMPLFAFFLARMGLITAAWMRRVRRYAVLVVFVVAAILTPPDVFSQLLMAVPMLLLYEVSIFVAAAVGRKEPEAGERA